MGRDTCAEGSGVGEDKLDQRAADALTQGVAEERSEERLRPRVTRAGTRVSFD